MTSNAVAVDRPSGLRRQTFVPSRAAVAANRWHVGVTAAAVVVSAAAVGVIAPLVF